MNCENAMEASARLVRQSLLRDCPIQHAEALHSLPEMLGTVTIDHTALRKAVLSELQGRSKNPLNALLGLLGFQLIRKQNLEGEWEDSLVDTDASLNRFLRVDENRLKGVLDRIIQVQESIEKNARQERKAQEARCTAIQKALNDYQETAGEQIVNYRLREESLANHVQYLMSMRRQEHGGEADCSDLAGILVLLGMEVKWPEDTDEKQLSAWFTRLETGQLANAGIKPCILGPEGIVARGMIIDLNTDEETQK